MTGTDFVSSLGTPEAYPGLWEKPNGCMKDKANHARQQTDPPLTCSSMTRLSKDCSGRKLLQDQSPNVCLLQFVGLCTSTELVVGIGVGPESKVVVALVIAAVLLCQGSDEGKLYEVGSGSATTNV